MKVCTSIRDIHCVQISACAEPQKETALLLSSSLKDESSRSSGICIDVLSADSVLFLLVTIAGCYYVDC